MSQYLLYLGGLVLVVVAISLYADSWQTRKAELEIREQKLSVLDDLQHETRQPYQLMQLLNISIREIVAHLPECAGAVFLLNRRRRQFVLASAVGLTKQETAALEYYPLERNLVSQAVDLGEPLIAGKFDFVERNSDQPVESRFNSCLLLPLVSGTDRIGGLILFAQQEKYFSNSEIRYLAPVADWLAEKIRSARLTRELAAAKKEVDNHQAEYAELTARFTGAVKAFTAREAANEFCRSLVGLAGCHSVHLLQMQGGAMHFAAGSEPLQQLTENYKTALVEALDRQKPLIINQEAVDEQGRAQVAFSSLVFPLDRHRVGSALLLCHESGAFVVDNSDLKKIEILVRLAVLVLDQSESRRLDITRRKGFEKILGLLRFDKTDSEDDKWRFLIDCLRSTLPTSASAIVLTRRTDGSYAGTDGFPGRPTDFADLLIRPGEGDTGQTGSGLEPVFVFGRSQVSRRLEDYQSSNREVFYRLCGDKQSPVLMATCPIIEAGDPVAVVKVFLFDIRESEKGEWERLITLAVGLFSTRLTVHRLLHPRESSAVPETARPDRFDEVVLNLNNHMSAIIGSAELVATENQLSEETHRRLAGIITEAELAAGLLKQTPGEQEPSEQKSGESPDIGQQKTAININEVLKKVLNRSHISENLHMIGGRPREINLSLTPVAGMVAGDDTVRRLAEAVLGHFASLAQDDDTITITTYQRDRYIYLDISRHHKDLPPVEPVAGFGTYQPAQQALKDRPADTFLSHVVDQDCACSLDRFGKVPSYLSFRFARLPDHAAEDQVRPDRARVLAIDDQPVILDLISAMCRSMGYEPMTAGSGEAGVKLASQSTFDIVLTDLAMPGMSGLETARRIHRLHPQTPIVLVTGWEANISPAELESAGIADVLYKPFRIEQLTKVIQSVVSPQPQV